MRDPIRDDAELMRVFDFARNHPDNWSQKFFFLNPGEDAEGISYIDAAPDHGLDCGTTYCMAGFKALILDGLTVDEVYDHHGDFERYGRESLGLTHDESEALFYCMDNEGVEDVVKAIMNDEYRDGTRAD